MGDIPGAPDQHSLIEHDEDADSALGDEIASSTESLNSLVLKFEYEYGRRYQAFRKGAYVFPNDEVELDRMDLHHFLSLQLFENKLHFAPLITPQKVLDLGTGTGIWALDMADQYPSASVVGVDLSPVQPKFVPPNLEFQVDDFELDWTFQPESFDFIHWRYLIACIADYPKLLCRAYDHIKPGGWMEIHEIDPQLYTDDDSQPKPSYVRQWSDLFNEAAGKMGKALPPIERYKGLMKEAGFVNVTELCFKQPGGVWPRDKRLKRIGLYSLTNQLNGLHAFTIGLFTKILGWSETECEVLIAKNKVELKGPKVHGYQKVYVTLFLPMAGHGMRLNQDSVVVYGQKPDHGS